jgi:hypothetical protein
VQFTLTADHGEFEGLAHGSVFDLPQQIAGFVDGLVIHRHDKITAPQARLFGRAALDHALHQGAIALRELQQGIGIPVVVAGASGRQGDQERACRYRNLWVADASGKWHRITRANTSATSELGRKDYGHRMVGDSIELRTGGYRHADGKAGTPLEIPTSGNAPVVDFAKLPGGV